MTYNFICKQISIGNHLCAKWFAYGYNFLRQRFERFKIHERLAAKPSYKNALNVTVLGVYGVDNGIFHRLSHVVLMVGIGLEAVGAAKIAVERGVDG